LVEHTRSQARTAAKAAPAPPVIATTRKQNCHQRPSAPPAADSHCAIASIPAK
jgi:hypothetical protein